MLESNCEAKDFKPDPVVWYDDGNIVLIAGSTAFKLYKGILASVSPVFKDMFAFPQNPTDCEIYDGCPVFHMPDIAQDLRPLLKALHDGRCAIIATLLSRHALIQASLS